ncbi:putative zinc-binding oxidoreductase [Fusarium oxysporum f. sp. conglutinans]|nr:putative zinc-binding oxidoreductase [Fusarium oxysporum f. sp. conglutinans]
MKAILQPDKHSHKLILSSQQPVPTPTHPQDVLVKVHATCPCKGELDWALWAPEFIGDKIPIPGQDLAGTVVSAPENSGFKPDDEVYARIEANRPGAAAEYVLARVSELAIRPKNLTWAETAASPISALTAYQGLFTRGGLDPEALRGDEAAREKNSKVRVLINGAAGGVGSWAVQLARIAGVKTITAVVGTQNIDFVRQLVREGGTLVSVCAVPEQNRPEDVKKEANTVFFVIDPVGKDLDHITKLLEAGDIKPHIDSVVGLDEFEEAWEKVESGRTKGKVVVMVMKDE